MGNRNLGEPMNYQLVHITWHDAHSMTETWTSVGELADDPDPYVVESVGWLLPHAKPGHVCIAQSYNDEDLDSVLAIPTGMIVKIARLEASALLPIEPDLR